MKKRSILIVALLLIISALFGCSKDEPGAEYMYLPKTVSITHSNTSGFHREQKIRYKYDEYGNTVKEEKFTKGMLFLRDHCFDTTFTYDENGMKLKEITRSEYFSTNITDEHSVIESGYEYTYDEGGKVIQKDIIYFHEVGANSYTPRGYRYEYDEYGNLIKEIRINTDGSETLSVEYSYNADSSVMQKNENNNAHTYGYNAKGQLISMKTVSHFDNSDATSVTEQTYEYDVEGRIISSKKYFYDWKGENTHHIEYSYTYDKLGRLIMEENIAIIQGGTEDSRTVYKYKDFEKIRVK